MSTIAAGTTTTTALVSTGDTTGALVLQTNGTTTAVTIDTSQNVGVGVTPSGNFLLQAGNFATNAARSFKLMALYGGISGGGYPQVGYNFRSTTTTSSYIYDVSDIASAINFQDGFLFKIAASGTAGNAITFTQALALEKDKSLALQGATPQTGTGITFPASQSASSDANTLDDYEEGIWTPSVTLNSGTATAYTIGTATYTKTGRVVVVIGSIIPTNGTFGNTNSYARMTGLPFTCATRVGTGSGGNSSNLNNGVATTFAYSTTVDVAFTSGVTSTNEFAFTVTYFV